METRNKRKGGAIRSKRSEKILLAFIAIMMCVVAAIEYGKLQAYNEMKPAADFYQHGVSCVFFYLTYREPKRYS